MTDLNLIVLGPPGAGKSTQAARLRDDLGLTYLSTGDILRRHYAAGAALGRRATCYMEEGQLGAGGVRDLDAARRARGRRTRRLPPGRVPRTTAQAYALD